ncbi:response regulator transcription factor [Niastella caeni]|uniref:Response regulator transcription factor n=1 Tax=Niastella caeni TaxID=2569763 RepID=A0A4S8H605_9BACT|nr:response regulator transcription factor [Niastella caeni]THU30220.1 response regulator transcription factor [Niastella caeni]
MNKFLLADDHHIVRTGLGLIIKEEYSNAEIDECSNGDCVWKKIQSKGYDLIILDITMPGMDSPRLLKNIFTLKPDQKVMIFSMSNAAIYAKKYLAMGVKGFINKEAEPSEVRLGIVAIMNNRKYLGNDLNNILTLKDKDIQAGTPFDSLSIRELEIMNHLVQGKNVSEIAEMLFLHISTVSTHKANIMEKLGVSNIVELTQMVQLFKKD